MKWVALGVMAVALSVGVASCGGKGTARGRITLLAPAAYQAAVAEPGAFVVNVHTPYEGEIPGTDAFIPYDNISANIDKLPADKGAPLYIYCRSGRMSAEASPALQALGYTDVIELDGGMQAWEAAGLPLTVRTTQVRAAG